MRIPRSQRIKDSDLRAIALSLIGLALGRHEW
jgi:hypothetical protein